MKRLFTLLLFANLSTTASAHDLRGIFREQAELSADDRQRIEDVKELRRLMNARARPGDRVLEAVVRKALRWEKSVLSVCFQDGIGSSREMIAAVAAEWTVGTSIRFDFGTLKETRTCSISMPSDIRVSLAGDANWSYVGRHAMGVSADKPTLHLSGINHGNPLSAYERFLVLHEFGHALGFEHEHQSPEGGCSKEFNWAALPKAVGFTEEQVRQNMARFDESDRKSGLVASAFDARSVMLYALPAVAFVDPSTARCYVADVNSMLSPLDKAGARYLYPVLSTGSLHDPHPSVAARGLTWTPDTRERAPRLQLQSRRS